MSLVLPAGPSGSGSDSADSQIKALLNVLSLLISALSQSADSLDVRSIQAELTQLQPLFQSLLASLAEAELAPADRQRIRPFQTEAHRRLRLLGVSAMQLRSAKQPETLARVRSQLQDHLQQFQLFIQAIDEVVGSQLR